MDNNSSKNSSIFSDKSFNNNSKKDESSEDVKINSNFLRERSRSLSSTKKNSNNQNNINLSNDKQSINSNNNSTFLNDKKFVIKNGCCRDCMKAFSKTGKSCLCQVPKKERRYTLPDKGCPHCGCKGCNPLDVQRDKRRATKEKYIKDNYDNIKKQRIIESDDEDLITHQRDIDDYNKLRNEFNDFIYSIVKNSYSIGFGIPKRSSSYILGYNPNIGLKKDNKNKYNRNNNRDIN